MVLVINEGKNLLYDLNEYFNVINSAKLISDKAIMHFLELIGLDSSLFEHLKDVKLVVDLDESNEFEDMIAFYENIWVDDHGVDNAIHFLPEYIEQTIEEKDDIRAINDLVRTIIHETIHANRSIIINNGVSFNGLLLNTYEYEEAFNKFSSFNYDTDKKYKVLKCEKNDYFYVIYAYNTITNDFNVFSLNLDIKFNSIDELEDLLINNNNLFGYICTIECPYDVNPSALISEYSTSFKNPSYLTKKDRKNVEIELNKQNGFEECLTEAFARIIFYLRNKNEFNFDQLLKNDKLTPDVKLALQLIKKMDMDTIRWFFLSCYEDEYTNKFYQLYKDNYYKLIDEFNEAYDCSMSNQEYDNYEEAVRLIKSL